MRYDVMELINSKMKLNDENVSFDKWSKGSPVVVNTTQLYLTTDNHFLNTSLGFISLLICNNN